MFQKLLSCVRRRTKPKYSSAALSAVQASGLFDAEWYLSQHPDVAAAKVDPLTHYMKRGWREGRRPGPAFDGQRYLALYPDIASANINPLLHYVRHGKQERRSPGIAYELISLAEELVENLGQFELDIAGDPAFKHVQHLHLASPSADTPLTKAWEQLFSSLTRTYERVIFVPWLVRGGAELVAANAARAVISQHGPGSVLFVVTDHDRLEAIDWLPVGCDLRVLSEYDPTASHEDRVRLVELLIFALLPKSVLNVNSRACWDAFKTHGQALRNISNLYAALFCRDYDEAGTPGGYAVSHLRTCLPHLTKLYVDNSSFAKSLAEHYGVPETLQDCIAVIRQPWSGNAGERPYRQHQDGRPLPVLWAGRFSRQKNVDLLLRIVEAAPNVQFDVFGEGTGPINDRLIGAAHNFENIRLKGPYSSIEALPTHRYSAFLFTSLWEGMPTTIINVALMGLPIVSSNVGGISELVNDDTGWLISDLHDPNPYIQALQEIARDSGKAQSKVARMRERVRSLHSWEAYLAEFAKLPSFIQ